ncbi:MAG: adenylate/guanylate cyclase domain-containing protein [Pseudomonadota bacterium]
MTDHDDQTAAGGPRARADRFDLADLPLWLVRGGMRAASLDAQLEAYCRQLHDRGFPVRRVLMGMNTLHPRYGMHTFLWRSDAGAIEYAAAEPDLVGRDVYRQSPVHHMRSRGVLDLRHRLDGSDDVAFPILAELRAAGLTDYAARIVPFDPAEAAAVAGRATTGPSMPADDEGLDGVFFSCATDRPGGFDDGELDQVLATLPFLALAVKARLTYDVATTVVETYLGEDAGHRVLTGAIARGSVETIRSVIWFSDLRGFTHLADGLAQDALIETLNDYLEAMARPVHDHGGQILKFLGDGLLANFALSGRDAATVCQDALAAARDLRRTIPILGDARRAAGKPVMEFGLALHLGDVLYGNVGACDRLDFTVIGPAVNEASRIQALCRPLDRDVLVSGSFQVLARAGDEFQALGEHALEGLARPCELFALRT